MHPFAQIIFYIYALLYMCDIYIVYIYIHLLYFKGCVLFCTFLGFLLAVALCKCMGFIFTSLFHQFYDQLHGCNFHLCFLIVYYFVSTVCTEVLILHYYYQYMNVLFIPSVKRKIR